MGYRRRRFRRRVRRGPSRYAGGRVGGPGFSNNWYGLGGNQPALIATYFGAPTTIGNTLYWERTAFPEVVDGGAITMQRVRSWFYLWFDDSNYGWDYPLGVTHTLQLVPIRNAFATPGRHTQGPVPAAQQNLQSTDIIYRHCHAFMSEINGDHPIPIGNVGYPIPAFADAAGMDLGWEIDVKVKRRWDTSEYRLIETLELPLANNSAFQAVEDKTWVWSPLRALMKTSDAF